MRVGNSGSVVGCMAWPHSWGGLQAGLLCLCTVFCFFQLYQEVVGNSMNVH